MAKWRGWVCGSCKERLKREDVIKPDLGDPYKRHKVSYLADYCGDQARYETEYCGPVRHYPRKLKSCVST